MDLSGVIFLALAVAWAGYLIPKALRYSDEVARTRSVDRFSERIRVLARREPVDPATAHLVRPATGDPELLRRRRAAARAATKRATRRRRNVLLVLLLAGAIVSGFAAVGRISWWYTAIPGALLVLWLVACRVMVRGERAAWDSLGLSEEPAAESAPLLEEIEVSRNEQGFDQVAPSASTAVMDAAGGLWDPLPVTLPTYVDAPPAPRRTVRTIDLESTGVWTSGRTEADADLARAADEERAATKAKPERNVG